MKNTSANKKQKSTSANMAFMSWSEITGMHLISWKGNQIVDISGEIAKYASFEVDISEDDDCCSKYYLIIASDPVFVDGDVFCIEQFAAWAVFPWK